MPHQALEGCPKVFGARKHQVRADLSGMDDLGQIFAFVERFLL